MMIYLIFLIGLIHYFPDTAEIIPLISTIRRGELTVLILKGIMRRVKIFSIIWLIRQEPMEHFSPWIIDTGQNF